MKAGDLYDLVTGLYLDCWNDGEVAEILGREVGERVDSHVVTTLRTEAAIAAEDQPVETRRRWIYRYQTVTVNNLVKEYMFMEQKSRFLQAKRELADEIDALVGGTDPERLCIAVNDALGRNNIGIEHIRELQDYALRHRKMVVAIQLFAETNKLTPEAALLAAADRIEKLHTAKCESDPLKTARAMGSVIGTDHIRYEPEDVAFLLEYKKLSGDDTNYPMMIKLLRGADLPSRHSTALDQIVSGTARHLTFEDLQDLIQLIRSRPVMQSDMLMKVRGYADRHVKDLETLDQLGIRRGATESHKHAEAVAVRQLRDLTGRHLMLLNAPRFVGESDSKKAAKQNISPTDLQTIMERINGMTHEHQIREFLEAIRTSRGFAFPTDRYLTIRFTLPAE